MAKSKKAALAREQHEARVSTLREAYEAKVVLPTTVKVMRYLHQKGLECTLDQAYRADIQSRNEQAADRTTTTVVPPAKREVRNPDASEDETLANEIALLRELCTKAENSENRMDKYEQRYPNSVEIAQLGKALARFGKEGYRATVLIDKISEKLAKA